MSHIITSGLSKPVTLLVITLSKQLQFELRMTMSRGMNDDLAMSRLSSGREMQDDHDAIDVTPPVERHAIESRKGESRTRIYVLLGSALLQLPIWGKHG